VKNGTWDMESMGRMAAMDLSIDGIDRVIDNVGWISGLYGRTTERDEILAAARGLRIKIKEERKRDEKALSD
jgi:hypothetical protein